MQTQSYLYSKPSLQITGEEDGNVMCNFHHPYYGCISFANNYRVNFVKKGVQYC